MNRNLYHLVFDRARNALVPVSEACSAPSASDTRAQRRRHLRAMARSVPALLALSAAPAFADPAKLPVPATNFVTSGSASQAVSGSTMTVTQSSNRAILNWNSFNIGAGHGVRFNQPNAAAIALNRIGSADPSVIAGQLSANGQIYLYNQNGILFAPGAQVNVAGLVASSLNISDDVFEQGILSVSPSTAQFEWTGSVDQFHSSFVRIDPGADIRTADGGRIMMFAPRIENAGRIESPGGQVILAAGAKVYLEASTSADLRGLLVEVDPLKSGSTIIGNGSISNQKLADAVGEIITARGNTTLVAHAINQDGRISATTSVNANGSIYLLARDNTSQPSPTESRIGMSIRSGTVTLGAGSTTQVLPETADKTTSVDAQIFNPSTVAVEGKKIWLQENASIVAPGGQISITARDRDPSVNPAAYNDSRIFVDRGVKIDASGMRGVEVAMERNIVTAELRGNELRDAPLQRDGILQGKTVKVDVRRDTDLADVSGYVAGIGRTVAERTSEGGTVTLQSQGDVVLREGSLIDVSGGSLRYLDGMVSTTKLVSNGKVLDISEASPDRVYSAVFDATPQREMGYVEGKSAGSVILEARGLVMDGALRGSTVIGPRQRSAADVPAAGRLVLGDADGGTESSRDFKLPEVLLSNAAGSLPAEFLANPMNAMLGERLGQVIVSTQTLRTGGFGRIEVYSNEAVNLAAPLLLPDFGSVKVNARTIDVSADVFAPGGHIALSSVATAGAVIPRFEVAEGVTLSTAGRWVNDRLDLSQGTNLSRLAIHGGSLSLSSYLGITVGDGALLDVSGGGQLTTAGKVTKGDAGSIAVVTNVGQSIEPFQTLDLRGQLRGYALGQGGSLALTARTVRIGASDDPGEFAFLPEAFRSGGFTRYQLNGILGVVVPDDTTILPSAQSFVLGSTYAVQPTGTPMLAGVATIGTLPDFERPATSVALSASNILGDLVLGHNARIMTEPGASVSLSAGNQLTVLGSIVAPAGRIDLAISSQAGQANETVGYLNTQSLWVDAGAELSARGVAKFTTNALGQRIGEVLPGGEITLTANRGYVVVRDGARIDVSGVSQTLDIAAQAGAGVVLLPRTVHGDAGSIRVVAREGVIFDASPMASPGGSSAEGGTFSVSLQGGFVPNYPNPDRTVVLQAAGNGLRPEDAALAPGDALETSYYNGFAFLSMEKLANAQLDHLHVVSESKIRLDGAVVVSAGGSVALDSRALTAAAGADARIEAPYVAIANLNANSQQSPGATPGSAHLGVDAGVIDLIGAITLQGFQSVSMHADSDIRLRGMLTTMLSEAQIGSLTGSGALNLTAQQVYPATLTDYLIDFSGTPGSSVTIGASGERPAVPLSAGANLTVKADTIVQGGRLRAPLGSIVLEGEQVQFTDGSLTSASAEDAVIPFGRVENATDWLYDLNFGSRIFDAPPGKRVETIAASVDIAQGAIIDLSGGGDLYAYEFVAGLGGSLDYLAQPGTYAVIPGFTGAVAPFDYQYARGSDIGVGDQIILSGGGGLPAGTYTLLPGHYALLPGAFSVRAVSGYQDIVPSQSRSLPEGSAIVAGRLTSSLTGAQAQRTSGYLIRSASLTRQRSEYVDFSANTFFPQQARRDNVAVPRLPIDAGRFLVAATHTLQLQGLIDLAAGEGGRGGLFDLNADKIAIVGTGQEAPEGFTAVSAGDLTRIGAESLLVGGTRSDDPGGIVLTIGASEIVLDGAGETLVAGEIILAATDGIVIADDSAIEAVGTPNLYGNDERIAVAGDGAIVRVSSDAQPRLQRSGATQAIGTLAIGERVLLKGNTVELDVTSGQEQALQLASTVTLSTKALGLGANAVTFGLPAPGTQTSGLLVGPQLLAQLESLEVLRLRADEGIDLATGAALGGEPDADGMPVLRSLILDAPVLRNAGASGEVVLLARNVTLANTGGASAAASNGSGTLVVKAQGAAAAEGTITLGAGSKAISGFDAVRFEAQQAVIGGDNGSMQVAGDATVLTPIILGHDASSQSLTAQGALIIATTAPSTETAGVAGRWVLTGTSVDYSGVIDLPAGSITLQATSGDVTLRTGSAVLARGFERRFDGVGAYASGGEVVLQSDAGAVVVEDGALVDVSAHAAGGDGGSLVLTAKTVLDVQGTLAGAAEAGRGGRVAVDTGSLADASTLLARIDAGGFDGAVSLRQRSGDLVLTAVDRIRAQRIALAADAGVVDVDGELDARGAKGGDIRLFGGNGARVRSGARLLAAASEASADGGQIMIDSGSGALAIDAGATFDLSGGAGGRGGSGLLRALRTGDGLDVAITAVDGSWSGAEAIYVEAVKRYAGIDTLAAFGDAGNPGVLGLDTVLSDNDAFMANANVITQRLGKSGDPTFVLRPGVEVRSAGDLVLAADWDLSDARAGGQPGYLTLRAAGDLKLDASLNDGIKFDVLQEGENWSYRLVGGADLAAADPLATLAAADTGGDVHLAAGVKVRTGTGFIEVAAQRDFVLASDTAALYTAGRQAAVLDGYIPASATAAFGERGGDVMISAGRDVVGAITSQLVTNWQYRMGTLLAVNSIDGAQPFEPGVQSSWWVEHVQFRQNVGALGGGDVTVSAGRDVADLSVMLPTSGRMSGDIPDRNNLQVLGGGDLVVRSGRDIRGGQFYVGKGEALIEAAGRITSGAAVPGGNGVALYPILFAADARFDLRAGGDAGIETILNPTVVGQTPPGYFDDSTYKSYFFTYSSDAAAAILSKAGNVTILGRSGEISRNVRSPGDSSERIDLTGDEETALTYFPGTLQLAALEGSVSIPARVTLFPSSQGHAEVFARDSVTLSGQLYMSDVDPSLLLAPERPFRSLQTMQALLTDSPLQRAQHALLPGSSGAGVVPLHHGDERPARIVAVEGDIRGAGLQNPLNAIFPKPARIIAGRDIVNLDVYAQNLDGQSLTQLIAGRDIRYLVSRESQTNQLQPNPAGVTVWGPGELWVIAGRDIDLGTSRGILTQGNLANPALADEGAALRVFAGSSVGVDANKFLSDFPGMDGAAGADLAERVRAFTGDTSLTDAQARAAFLELDAQAQQQIALDMAHDAFARTYLQDEGIIAANPQAWTRFAEQAGVDPNDPALDALLAFRRELNRDGALREALNDADIAVDLTRSYRDEWQAFAEAQGLDADTPTAQALDQFRFVLLWPELRASGREAVGSGDYARGYDALALAGLGAPFTADGNINLIFSQLKTERGGIIEIVAPGGGVNVGLATPPAGFNKGPDQLGILSVKGGDVRAAVRDDIQVNQSRVFTLEGGDILLWSSEGNIDAGRGAKTAISVPPPIVRVSSTGDLVVEFPGAASGSGIGVLLTRPDIEPGDVDLIAPTGTVNAGDAGIRAAGNLTIAAVRVIGADNIQVGGTSAGVPLAPSSSGASLSGLGNTAAEAAKSAEQATEQMGSIAETDNKDFLPSFLTVEVIGLGDEDEEERRRRQSSQ